MKSKIIATLFFLFSALFLFADSLTLVKRIDARVSFFTTDHLGNFYLVTDSGLYKFDKDGNFLFSFTEKKIGVIHFVDATDPMKTLIYNKDFSSVTILDNKLSFNTEFNLRELGLQQPLLICTSRHDGYWIFDKQTNQLKKFNSALQPLFESSDITQLINTDVSPLFLTESEKWIWMHNLSSGIMMFDAYGTYLRTVDTSQTSAMISFQAEDDRIIFSEGNKLVEINPSKLTRKEISYPGLEDVSKMRIEQNRLYVMKKGIFEIYSF